MSDEVRSSVDLHVTTVVRRTHDIAEARLAEHDGYNERGGSELRRVVGENGGPGDECRGRDARKLVVVHVRLRVVHHREDSGVEVHERTSRLPIGSISQYAMSQARHAWTSVVVLSSRPSSTRSACARAFLSGYMRSIAESREPDE